MTRVYLYTSYRDLKAAVIAAERARLYVSMPAGQYDAERQRQEREIGRHIGEGRVVPVRVREVQRGGK